jgi:hypothetical protein
MLRKIIIDGNRRQEFQPQAATSSPSLGNFNFQSVAQNLRAIDFQRLSFELAAFDLTVPVIATPREIVRKFFR